ncbi:Double-strand break repair protein [Meloidogyne graminicola]|uniref:Double-strand break repair protein n=1 Tax=Meloidogyne graminicola TaxID=189291 RepID=A0A8S9ZEQ1_9BILA|nr:Double-strand break repair protein [Meloidogyne graminicola]
MVVDADIIKFLIASDIHAGYGENKQYIGNDSFESLREVLSTAKESKVDFILLGGDLFHENHPSRETQLKVVRLLRTFCTQGEKPDLDFVSDPTINFQHSNFPSVNYLDENLRITMPIFTIHGNHDDLSGKGLSSLDVLHESGLLNLFGKYCDLDQIEVSPILLQRGNTKIALYGIGSQRDDRLARAFSRGRIKFRRPEGLIGLIFFKLRSTKSHLSFKCLPTFFDVVIWGHEHECLIEPDFKHFDDNDQSKSFYIIQPGSTVATALSTEEAKRKHIGIMTVCEKKFKLKKIELKTVRQLIIDELDLNEYEPSPKIAKTTIRQKNMRDEQLIEEKIENMLSLATAQREPGMPYPPRIRLKVVYSGKWLNIPPINGRKFGAKYADRVANHSEMLFVRVKREEKKAVNVDGSIIQILGDRPDDVFTVDEMVNKFYGNCEFKKCLTIISENVLAKQLEEYSNTDTNTQFKYTHADRSLTECIKEQISGTGYKVKNMMKDRIEDNDKDVPILQKISECIQILKRERLGRSGRKLTDVDSSNLNDTIDTLSERGFDPERIVTSTPRASQEREEWLSNNSRANEDVEMSEGIETVSEHDFSP